MQAALSQLLLLRLRGGVRSRLRQLASLRGIGFLLVISGIVWMLLGRHTSSPGDDLSGTLLQDPHHLRRQISTFMPLALLGASLFTAFVATGRAIYFSPSEINFLFAGPFSRRDLLVYKFCAYLTGAVLSAAILTLLIPPRASTGVAAFTGSLLTLLFIQLSSAALGMVSQTLEGRRFTPARGPVILVLLAVAATAIIYVFAATGNNIVDVLAAFRHSRLGTIVLAPFIVFAELFLAERIFPDLAGWTVVAVAINGAFLLVIIALDRRLSDRSLAESRRLSNRWLRIRRGSSFWASDKRTGRSMRRAPFVGGLGPVVWRQAINAVRNSGRVILVFMAIAALAGPIVRNVDIRFTDAHFIGFLYFCFAFVIPRTLVCDFRGELDSIELYKALPIAPWRICTAQLVIPVALSIAIELIMSFSIMPFLDHTSTFILLGFMFFALPFNLLLYALENLISLSFPTKLVPVGRVDFDFLGRAVVDFILKTIIIFAALAVARAAGLAVRRAAGQSWLSFGLTSWLTLALIGLLTIPLLAYAFRRFSIGETIK